MVEPEAMTTRNEYLSDQRDAIQGTQMISWEQGVAAILAHLDMTAQTAEQNERRIDRLERMIEAIAKAAAS